MSHPFMEATASGLADVDIATVRYQFPYMEARSRRPDPPERPPDRAGEIQGEIADPGLRERFLGQLPPRQGHGGDVEPEIGVLLP